ncbi:unnamed protein product [Auanema sp. JU1783]|nr:unnamed protein product [Auanema sp. JU1783]
MVLIALLGFSAASAFVVKNQETLVISSEAEVLSGEALASYVNANQKLWTAKNPNLSEEKQKAKLMDLMYLEAPAADEIAPELQHIQLDDIPTSFDARKQWAQCPSIGAIRDQSDCGACWAFAAAEAMSDRTCIASNAKVNPTLSADDILSCCGSACGNGCKGGYPIQAFKFWNSHGVCTGGLYGSHVGCKPYPFAPCGSHANEQACPESEYDTPKCTSTCLESSYKISYNDDKHYGKTAYGVSKNVAAIQKELMSHGPVEAAFTVYEDFYHYTGGVYVHTGGKRLGGHAVKIVGWGVDNGTPYWNIANSWSTTWGEKGFFRIIRGVNEVGIEGGIVAGLPRV